MNCCSGSSPPADAPTPMMRNVEATAGLGAAGKEMSMPEYAAHHPCAVHLLRRVWRVPQIRQVLTRRAGPHRPMLRRLLRSEFGKLQEVVL